MKNKFKINQKVKIISLESFGGNTKFVKIGDIYTIEEMSFNAYSMKEISENFLFLEEDLEAIKNKEIMNFSEDKIISEIKAEAEKVLLVEGISFSMNKRYNKNEMDDYVDVTVFYRDDEGTRSNFTLFFYTHEEKEGLEAYDTLMKKLAIELEEFKNN